MSDKMVGVTDSPVKYEALNDNQLLQLRFKKVPLSIFSVFTRKYKQIKILQTVQHLLIFGISLK